MTSPTVDSLRDSRLSGLFATRHLLLICVLVAAVGFEALWFGVVTDSGLAALDPSVTKWMVGHRGAGLIGAARAISDVGAPVVAVVAVAAMLVWLAWRMHWQSCALGASGLGLVIGLDVTMKSLIARPRPPVGWHAVLVQGPSFPSGHAMLSAGAVLLMALLAHRHALLPSGLRGYALGALACCLLVAVGASRVVLGVHYPSDVLAGWMLALLVVAGVASLGAAWNSRAQP